MIWGSYSAQEYPCHVTGYANHIGLSQQDTEYFDPNYPDTIEPLPIEYPFPSTKSLSRDQIDYREVKGADLAVVLPNPSDGEFTIILNQELMELQELLIQVVDMQGHLVATPSRSGVIQLDMSDRPSGVYILNISRDGFEFGSVKLVKE